MNSVSDQECRTCGGSFPRTAEFFTPRKATDRRAAGFTTQCKECRKQQRKLKAATPKATASEKACAKCGEVKPAADFPKNAHSATGLKSQCKACRATGPQIPRSRRGLPDGVKRCSACGEAKPMTREFFYRGAAAGGLHPKCIACELAASRSEEAVAKRKADYAAKRGDPEYIELNRERMRAYSERKKAEDPAGFREKQREASQRHYYSDLEMNRLKARAASHARRAKLLEVGGQFSAEDIEGLLDRQRCCCAYCGVDLRVTGYHVDHVVPVKLGGGNDPANLALACPLCNQSKGDRKLEAWVKRPDAADSLEFTVFMQGNNPDWRPPWRRK